MLRYVNFTLRLWLVVLACLLGNRNVHAITSAEQSAYNLAEKALNSSAYPQAEKFFTDFLTKFPSTELKLQSYFSLAQARYWQSNYAGALSILQTNLPISGVRSNEFLKWMADSAEKSGNGEESARYLEQLAQGDSVYASGASLNLANLLFKKKEYTQAATVLNRRFVGGKDALPNLDLIGKAEVLLNKINLQLKANKKPATLLTDNLHGQVDSGLLSDVYFTRGRVDLQNRDMVDLRINTSNLLVLATNPAFEPARLLALFLQGAEAFQTNNYAVALTNFTSLSEQEVIPWLQGLSLNYVGEIKTQAGDLDSAIKYFGDFVTRTPNAPGIDIARLNLADIYLKKFAATNSPAGGMQASLTNLQALKMENLEPADQGRKRMLEGWIYIQNGNREQALAAFSQAALLVQDSFSRQVVTHKLADTRFEMGDYAKSLADYLEAASLCQVGGTNQAPLCERALYQIIRCAIFTSDQSKAEYALSRLSAEYPNSNYAEQGLLLLGQSETKRGKPLKARQLFETFRTNFPNSKMITTVRIAMARTFSMEGDWENAVKQLDAAVSSLTDSNLLAQVEFHRAITLFKAGQETNALSQITNFVARFPESELVPRARNWIADYYWNKGEFANADRNYQLLFRNAKPGDEFYYRGKVNAGRAAFAGQQFVDAIAYFTDLSRETNLPPAIAIQAFFGLGDAFLAQYLADPVQQTNALNSALTAFDHITKNFGDKREGIAAYGRIGDAYLQGGIILGTNVSYFEDAGTSYRKLIELLPDNDWLRQQAQIGLAKTYEKQENKVDEALTEYFKVLFMDITPATETYWMEVAGLDAGRLCETTGRLDQAIKVFARLMEISPPLKNSLTDKIAALKKRSSARVD